MRICRMMALEALLNNLIIVLFSVTLVTSVHASPRICSERELIGSCTSLGDLASVGSRRQAWMQAILDAVQERDIDPQTVLVNNAPSFISYIPDYVSSRQQIAPVSSLESPNTDDASILITITGVQLLQFGWHIYNSPTEEFVSTPWMNDDEFARLAREWFRIKELGSKEADLAAFERRLPPEYRFLRAIFENTTGPVMGSFYAAADSAYSSCIRDSRALLTEIVLVSLGDKGNLPSYDELIDSNAPALRAVTPDCLMIE